MSRSKPKRPRSVASDEANGVVDCNQEYESGHNKEYKSCLATTTSTRPATTRSRTTRPASSGNSNYDYKHPSLPFFKLNINSLLKSHFFSFKTWMTVLYTLPGHHPVSGPLVPMPPSGLRPSGGIGTLGAWLLDDDREGYIGLAQCKTKRRHLSRILIVPLS